MLYPKDPILQCSHCSKIPFQTHLISASPLAPPQNNIRAYTGSTLPRSIETKGMMNIEYRVSRLSAKHSVTNGSILLAMAWNICIGKLWIMESPDGSAKLVKKGLLFGNGPGIASTTIFGPCNLIPARAIAIISIRPQLFDHIGPHLQQHFDRLSWRRPSLGRPSSGRLSSGYLKSNYSRRRTNNLKATCLVSLKGTLPFSGFETV